MIDGVEHALMFGIRGDNTGPPASTEVKKDWAAIKKIFPNATVREWIDLTRFYVQVDWKDSAWLRAGVRSSQIHAYIVEYLLARPKNL